MKRIVIASIIVGVSAPFFVAAKTLDQLSTDLSTFIAVTSHIAAQEHHQDIEVQRESSQELLPAMEGGKPTLTLGQKNILKRCEDPVYTMLASRKRRCAILQCQLLEMGCKR